MKIIQKIKFGIVAYLMTTPLLTLAQVLQDPATNNQGTISNPLKQSVGNDIWSLINSILSNIVMPIAAVVSVMYIIWAGFQFVLAQGNEGQLTKAKQNLLWALIGVGVLLAATGISAVLKNTVLTLVNTN